MSKHPPNAPSAPPDDELPAHINDGSPYPRIEHNDVQQTGAAGSSGEFSSPHPPPPSYQDAVNYPPAYQSNTFPKQTSTEGQPQDFQYPPYPTATHYNTMPGGGATPITNNYVIHHPLPQPASATTITVVPAGNCIHCLTGNVQSETNVCCLICLIILAICTFPFGLVLLCCIPCTVRRRCGHCRRLNP